MIGGHFWREPPQENESRTMIGLFGERNVCRFETAVCGEERCVTTLKTAAKETIEKPVEAVFQLTMLQVVQTGSGNKVILYQMGKIKRLQVNRNVQRSGIKTNGITCRKLNLFIRKSLPVGSILKKHFLLPLCSF